MGPIPPYLSHSSPLSLPAHLGWPWGLIPGMTVDPTSWKWVSRWLRMKRPWELTLNFFIFQRSHLPLTELRDPLEV